MDLLRKKAVRSKTEQLQKKEKLKVVINNIVDVVASGHASAALLTKLTALEEDLEVLEKPEGGHHRSLHDVTNAVHRVYTQASGKKPTLTSDTSAERLPRQMNSYEELLLESVKVIKPHMTLNGARELDRAATGQRLKALK